MMLFIDKTKCTGCGACVQRCPTNCISWVEGDFAFRYPKIDTEKCIDCGLCERVCTIGKNRSKPIKQRAYAVVHKKSEILEKSTSGGMFTVLAEYILNLGGVVYGASMEESFQVKHIRVSSSESLDKLRGSKYVQSDIGDTYRMAETDLKLGKYVLFTGTPCQIAGLYGFLGRYYESLVTADIVCHGVGSQKYFDRFMECLTIREGEIDELHFRSKKVAGWSCGGAVTISLSEQKKRHKPFYDYNNYYYYYFLRGDIYRESCYSCPYANTARPGDFTLGDFWGVETLKLPVNTERGCSLVLVNTPKAEEIFAKLDSVSVTEVTLAQAIAQNGQLRSPTKRSVLRFQLLNEYNTMSGPEIDQQFKKRHKKKLALLHLKALLPYRMKRIIRRFR